MDTTTRNRPTEAAQSHAHAHAGECFCGAVQFIVEG